MTVLYIFLLTVLFIGLLLPIWYSVFLFVWGWMVALVGIDIIKQPYNVKTIWLFMVNLYHYDYIISSNYIIKNYSKQALKLLGQNKNKGFAFNERIIMKDGRHEYALPFNIAMYNILVAKPELLEDIEEIIIKQKDHVIYDFARITRDIKFSRRKFLVAIKDRKIRDEFVKLFVNDEKIGKLASLL